MKKIELFAKRISVVSNGIALVALTVMLILVTVDIVGSKIFSKPVPGAMDVTSLLGILVIGFAMTQSYRMGRHIKVDFVTALLPDAVAKVIRFVSLCLCIIFFIFVVWRLFLYANDLWEYGEKSLTVKIPLYPFAYALAVAFLPLLVVIPIQITKIWKSSGE
jgi:TRAP-type C4-dicarboxylate transport system permease small subunit